MALTASEQQRLQQLQGIERNAAQEKEYANLLFKRRQQPTTPDTPEPTTQTATTTTPDTGTTTGTATTEPEQPSATGEQMVEVTPGVFKSPDDVTNLERQKSVATELGLDPDLFQTERQRLNKLETNLERQAREAKEARERRLEQAREQQRAVRSSTTASIMGSREGAVSAAQESGVRAVGRDLTRQQDELTTQLAEQQRSLDAIQEQKRREFATASIERRERLAELEAETAQKIAETQEKLSEAEKEAREGAMDVAKQAQSSVENIYDSLGMEGLAAADTGNLIAMVGNAALVAGAGEGDLPRFVESALARKQIADAIQETKDPNELQQLTDAFNQVKGLSSDIQTALSPAIADDLLGRGIIDEKTAGRIKEAIGKEQGVEVQTLQEVQEEAKRKNINLKNIKRTQSGAALGVEGEDPTKFFSGFDFGDGKRGSVIKDEEGNTIAKISSGYGADHSKISGEKFHNGLDLVFNNNEVKAFNSGVVVDKGFDKDNFGGYVWVQGDDGRIMQYAHLNVGDVNTLQVGDIVNKGTNFARQETNNQLWGSSTGAHTDVRFVGVQDDSENTAVKEWGYSILDGRANISNAPKELRSDIVKFTNDKIRSGYKSNYPVLTETQVKLVNQLSDDFNGDKKVTDMLDVKAGYDTVRTIYGNDQKIANATGFDDVSAINAFQRMVDPGATVREGDVTLLQTAIPFFKRAAPDFAWDRFTKGDKLPTDVRESLARVARDIYNTKANSFNSTTGERFKKRAEAVGVDFNLVGEEFTVFEPEGERSEINNSYQEEIDSINQELAEIESQLGQSVNQPE